jgi:hypothetical protein
MTKENTGRIEQTVTDIVEDIAVGPAIDHARQLENISLIATPIQTGSIANSGDIAVDHEIDPNLLKDRIDWDHRGREPTMPMDGVNHGGGADPFHLRSEGPGQVYVLPYKDRGLRNRGCQKRRNVLLS